MKDTQRYKTILYKKQKYMITHPVENMGANKIHYAEQRVRDMAPLLIRHKMMGLPNSIYSVNFTVRLNSWTTYDKVWVFIITFDLFLDVHDEHKRLLQKLINLKDCPNTVRLYLPFDPELTLDNG